VSKAIVAMNDDNIPYDLQTALQKVNKTYQEKLAQDTPISPYFKKLIQDRYSNLDFILFMKKVLIKAQTLENKDSIQSLYFIYLANENYKQKIVFPICTFSLIAENGYPLSSHLEAIINKMIELKFNLTEDEIVSPRGTHWRALKGITRELCNITFNETGIPLYNKKPIKKQSFSTSKIVQLIDKRNGELILKNEDIGYSAQVLHSRIRINPSIILKERFDHYEAVSESIESAIILHSGQSAAASCVVL
jgi:hypothetical protein